ncbi:hypothetical protein Tco_1461734 [Tanacetum coccineum]
MHPSYMSLQFPLLFIYGEDGYSKNLKLTGGVGSSTAKRRISMKAYYAIDFIREHQNDIRNEYLSGIYDAITRGESDGSDFGARNYDGDGEKGGAKRRGENMEDVNYE